MNPNDYCRDKAAADGSSLHYSLLFLDAPKRQAIVALHAFREEIADIVARCTDIEPARAKLAWWRMEVGALFAQRPGHPVTQALAEVMQRFPLTPETLLEIIDGFDTDLDRGRYDDYQALLHYCHRTASTVSVLTAEVLGYRNPHTAAFAHDLGLAMQLAAIIRDAGLHARQGRIYLPLDELRRFGVSEDDILAPSPASETADNIRQLLAFNAERARNLFKTAFSQLQSEDRSSQRPLIALAALQQTVLDEIETDGYRVLDRSLSLTPLRKLWIATRSWIR